MTAYFLPVLAYLLGSISAAIVLARLMGLKDPRHVGSGNPGATNILRYAGKKAAVITLLGDMLKGVVAVLIARALHADTPVLATVMLAVFLGHLFPIFHGFRGGKGVATAFGALVALNPWVGLAIILTWLVVAVTFRYSSLSAISAALTAPAYVAWLAPRWEYVLVTVIMSLLLLWRHRTNIANLVSGKEAKIGAGATAPKAE